MIQQLIETKSFSDYHGQVGKLADFSNEEHPSEFYAWDKFLLFTHGDYTVIGFVYGKACTIISSDWVYTLKHGMYFSVPMNKYHEFKICGGEGFAIVRKNYKGFFHLGGPVEEDGRLKYIDGCKDSLLIPPVKLGDPCLNLLVFPPGTNQTMHTHPSVRLGMVISGKGVCVVPEGEIPLYPGQIFCPFVPT